MKDCKVIIPSGIHPYPHDFEISAAVILSRYFRQDVIFIARGTLTTPDVIIGNIRWEIKSPTGSGKRNIQHQFNRAMKQSKSIVFDARRSGIDIRKIRGELKRQVLLTRGMKRLILITKEGKIEILK